MASILSLEGVTKAYGAVTVADDQSWSLPEGEALGVIGPNGAGKTSMFNLITGAIMADRGTVRFAGQDVTRWPAARRCRAVRDPSPRACSRPRLRPAFPSGA